jgi:hypothetical protein
LGKRRRKRLNKGVKNRFNKGQISPNGVRVKTPLKPTPERN